MKYFIILAVIFTLAIIKVAVLFLQDDCKNEIKIAEKVKFLEYIPEIDLNDKNALKKLFEDENKAKEQVKYLEQLSGKELDERIKQMEYMEQFTGEELYEHLIKRKQND